MNKEEYIENWKEYPALQKCIYKLQVNRFLDRKTKGRELIALTAFNKLLIQYTSLIKIIPNNDFSQFDKTSISGIARGIIELSNNMFFYGIEDVNDDEAQFRISLFEYISKRDRQGTLKKWDVQKETLDELNLSDEELVNLKSDLCSNPTFIQLIKENRIMGFDSLVNPESSKNKYLRRHSILNSRGIDEKFVDGLYKMSSVFIHNSPGAIDQHRNYLVNYHNMEREDLKLSVSLMQVPSSFIANSILDFSKYTDPIDELLSTDEIKLVKDFANLILKKSK